MAATTPQETAAPPRHGHPWGWITLCAVLVAGLVGVGIWALSLNSDLNDQKDATAKAQQQAKAAQDQVSSISSQVDDLSTKVSQASDQLKQAGADAQQNAQDAINSVQTDIDGVKSDIQGFKGKLDTLKTKVKDAVDAAGGGG
jgi:chromosome segregation ATPase